MFTISWFIHQSISRLPGYQSQTTFACLDQFPPFIDSIFSDYHLQLTISTWKNQFIQYLRVTRISLDFFDLYISQMKFKTWRLFFESLKFVYLNYFKVSYFLIECFRFLFCKNWLIVEFPQLITNSMAVEKIQFADEQYE